MTTNLKNIAHPPVLGGEICLEFPSWGVYPWQQYLGGPTLGVAVSALDLGNRDILGQMIATYPYVLINCAKGKYVQQGRLSAAVRLCYAGHLQPLQR